MTCLFCERPAQLHHLTGRLTARDPYLDPLLTLPLCAAHHGLAHGCWRALGIDHLDDPSQARLRRLSFQLLQLADREVDLPAGICGPLGSCLADIAGGLR